MKIKSKIENLVNTFIADPENAQKEYEKIVKSWNNLDIKNFWRLVASQNEQIEPIYNTATAFLDYLIENKVVTPQKIVTEFKDFYDIEGYNTDIGLVSFTETYLANTFYSTDINMQVDPELFEEVKQAETTWYWRHILKWESQNTICCNDLFVKIVDCL